MTGQQIRQRRQAIGISAAELAAIVGMAHSTLTYIERSLTPLTPETELRIKAVLSRLMAARMGAAFQESTELAKELEAFA